MKVMRIVGALVVVALCWTGGSAVAAVPDWTTFAGRLTDSNGTPMAGTYNITFKLFDAFTAGNQVWGETHTGVNIQDGLVLLQIGSESQLEMSSLVDGTGSAAPRFLQIEVGATAMTPRVAIGMVPYAKYAEHAEVAVLADDAVDSAALGGVAPGGYATASHLHDATYLKIGTAEATGNTNYLTCSATHPMIGYDKDNGNLVCDAKTFLPQGASAVDGTTSTSKVVCDSGKKMRGIDRDNGNIICEDDLTTGAGNIIVNTDLGSGMQGGDTGLSFTLALQDCFSNNEILKYSTATGWACAADQNSGGDVTEVQATPGGGLAVTTGTGPIPSVGLMTTCQVGELLKYTAGTPDFWGCAPGDADITGITASGGLAGTCAAGACNLSISADGVTSAMIAAGAVGSTDIANDAITMAKMADDAVGINELVNCTNPGDIFKYTAADTWACVADSVGDITDLTGGTGITITNGTTANPTIGITAGGVTATEIANTTITATKLANDTLTATQIAADAIGVSELANNAVDTLAIQDVAVTGAKLANCSAATPIYRYNGTQMACGAVQSADITDGSITTDDLATGAVGLSDIALCAANTVLKMNSGASAWTCVTETDQYVGDITDLTGGTGITITNGTTANPTVSISTNGVTGGVGGVIQDDSITGADLGPGAVGTSELALCSANYVYKMNGAGNAWICSAEVDQYVGDITDLTGGTGITITNGTTANPTISISTNGVTGGVGGVIQDDSITGADIGPGAVGTSELALCSANYVYKVNGAGNAWICSAEVDQYVGDITDLTGGTGITITNGTTANPTIGITAGGVTATEIANTTITATKLANDTLTATQIGADAIGVSELANNAVDTLAIQDVAVTGAKLANCSAATPIYRYNGTQMACGAVQSADISDGAITTDDLATGAVGLSDIALCGANTILKMNSGATSWTCVTETDQYVGDITDLTGGTGITITNGTTSNPTIGISTGGVTTTEILNATITNADISATAAIDASKLNDVMTLSTAQSATGIKTFSAATNFNGAVTVGAVNATFDTNTLYVNATTNFVGIGTASPRGALDVAPAVAAADTATSILYLEAQDGGPDGADADTIGTVGGGITLVTGTGGLGSNSGDLRLECGAGGAATTGGVGGEGGEAWLYSGAGGSTATTMAAGSGGEFTIALGYGGSSSSATAAGAGGNLSMSSGGGGSNSSTGAGGSAGGVSLFAANGGNALSTLPAGSGGNVTIYSGSGGTNSSSGYAGYAGNVYIYAGTGGSSSTGVDTAGGDVIIYGGGAYGTAEDGQVEIGGSTGYGTVSGHALPVKATIVGGDLAFSAAGAGILLRDTNNVNACYLVRVTAGSLGITGYTCP